mmetsp:Transcript_3210/g.7386  ORF Transcript_3210/g.7386 Transcript_3210/m.7386 type:complete len:200 (+) Transcript_3210:255-854(+)
MSHSPAWRGGSSSDEANNRLVRVTILLQPFSGFLLGTSTDLSDHDDTFRLWVVSETFKNIDEVRTVEGVSTDTDASRLSKSCHGRLPDSLVRQSSGPRNDADLTGFVDVPWHDSNFAFSWLDDPWTVRTDKTRRRLLPQRMFDPCHVLLGDALRNRDDEWDFRLDSIHNRLCTEWWWDVNNGRIRLDSILRFCDRVEDR